jgi:hypothetical protein
VAASSSSAFAGKASSSSSTAFAFDARLRDTFGKAPAPSSSAFAGTTSASSSSTAFAFEMRLRETFGEGVSLLAAGDGRDDGAKHGCETRGLSGEQERLTGLGLGLGLIVRLDHALLLARRLRRRCARSATCVHN